MERGKRAKVFSKERLSLAEPLLFQNSPPDYFEIHLLQSAYRMGISPSADGDGGVAPRPYDPFEKGSIENFSFLDKLLRYAA